MPEEIEYKEMKKKMLDFIKLLNELEDKFGSEINKANIFAAAGLVRQEIRHSTILAFLLDPNGWHGVGDFLLKRIAAIACEGRPEELDIAFHQWDDARISTEVSVNDNKKPGRLDIFIKSKLNKLLLVIENKVDARQGLGQLEKYRTWIENQPDLKNYTKLYLYLTVNEEDPNDNNWVSLSYSDLVFNLEDALKIRARNITPNGKIYIEQYIDLVKRYIMRNDSEEFVKYCVNLWEKHGELLNKIYENEPTKNIDAMDKFLKETQCEKIALSKDRLYCLPANLIPVCQKTVFTDGGWGWGAIGYPLHFEFVFKENPSTVELSAYVGPVAEPSIRSELIEKLRKVIDSPPGARRDARKYTKILGPKVKSLPDGAADVDIAQEMSELLKDADDDINRIHDVFAEILRVRAQNELV